MHATAGGAPTSASLAVVFVRLIDRQWDQLLSGAVADVQDVDGVGADGEQDAIAPVEQLSNLERCATLGCKRTPVWELLKCLRSAQEAAPPVDRASGGVRPDALVDGLEVGLR